ncbi:unnamed protein product [Closterium sp. Yama58-4]|nr:unnamed protein product [Closterium sp. Yama58-4]
MAHETREANETHGNFRPEPDAFRQDTRETNEAHKSHEVHGPIRQARCQVALTEVAGMGRHGREGCETGEGGERDIGVGGERWEHLQQIGRGIPGGSFVVGSPPKRLRNSLLGGGRVEEWAGRSMRDRENQVVEPVLNEGFNVQGGFRKGQGELPDVALKKERDNGMGGGRESDCQRERLECEIYEGLCLDLAAAADEEACSADRGADVAGQRGGRADVAGHDLVGSEEALCIGDVADLDFNRGAGVKVGEGHSEVRGGMGAVELDSMRLLASLPSLNSSDLAAALPALGHVNPLANTEGVVESTQKPPAQTHVGPPHCWSTEGFAEDASKLPAHTWGGFSEGLHQQQTQCLPSDPAVAASDSPAEAPDPAVAASEPAVAASEPAVAASDPAVAASDPAVAAIDPPVQATEQVATIATEPAVAALDLHSPPLDPAVAALSDIQLPPGFTEGEAATEHFPPSCDPPVDTLDPLVETQNPFAVTESTQKPPPLSDPPVDTRDPFVETQNPFADTLSPLVDAVENVLGGRRGEQEPAAGDTDTGGEGQLSDTSSGVKAVREEAGDDLVHESHPGVKHGLGVVEGGTGAHAMLPPAGMLAPPYEHMRQPGMAVTLADVLDAREPSEQAGVTVDEQGLGSLGFATSPLEGLGRDEGLGFQQELGFKQEVVGFKQQLGLGQGLGFKQGQTGMHGEAAGRAAGGRDDTSISPPAAAGATQATAPAQAPASHTHSLTFSTPAQVTPALATAPPWCTLTVTPPASVPLAAEGQGEVHTQRAGCDNNEMLLKIGGEGTKEVVVRQGSGDSNEGFLAEVSAGEVTVGIKSGEDVTVVMGKGVAKVFAARVEKGG